MVKRTYFAPTARAVVLAGEGFMMLSGDDEEHIIVDQGGTIDTEDGYGTRRQSSIWDQWSES